MDNVIFFLQTLYFLGESYKSCIVYCNLLMALSFGFGVQLYKSVTIRKGKHQAARTTGTLNYVVQGFPYFVAIRFQGIDYIIEKNYRIIAFELCFRRV